MGIKTKSGEEKALTAGDPLWDTLDSCRVRFVRMVGAAAVEVADNETGRTLPDWRHPSQVLAY